MYTVKNDFPENYALDLHRGVNPMRTYAIFLRGRSKS